MLLNLIKHQQPDIDKIYLYGKDPLESKYQLLINRIEKLVIENLKKQKAFIDHSLIMKLIVFMKLWKTKKRKVVILFDDMIADIESDKKIKFCSHWIVFKRKKTQYFSCFYFTILFQSP